MSDAGYLPSRTELGEGMPIEAMVSKCWQIARMGGARLGHG